MVRGGWLRKQSRFGTKRYWRYFFVHPLYKAMFWAHGKSNDLTRVRAGLIRDYEVISAGPERFTFQVTLSNRVLLLEAQRKEELDFWTRVCLFRVSGIPGQADELLKVIRELLHRASASPACSPVLS